MTPAEIAAVTKTLETALGYLEHKRTIVEPKVPRAHTILASVLDETGYRDEWEANTLTAAEHTELLHLVRMEGRRHFREMAERTLDEIDNLESKSLFGPAKDKISGFFRSARKYARELFVAGVLAFAGPAPLDAAELRALDAEVAVQEKYLKTFEREIVEENKPLDGTFVARAEQYGASVWGAAQEILRQGVAADHSYSHERRIHQGEDKPCPVCIEEEAKGWQPIGKLRKIGDSPCRCQCHCVLVFGEPGDVAKAFGLHEKRYVPCRDARGRFASCNGAPQGTRHPRPDGHEASKPGGGKKPKKKPGKKKPVAPKKPQDQGSKKPPKEPKKPAEKKPAKEKPAKPEKPAEKPGPGKSPAAPGPGESWKVSPAAAKDWVKDSVFPVTLYHRTYAPAKADIESHGINMEKTSGVYGQGLYASTKHEKAFGPETVEVALNIRNPLIGTADDIHRLQREWGPPGIPLHSTGFRDEVVRRGYDSVIMHWEPTYQGPSGANWVVVMKPETARFIQR